MMNGYLSGFILGLIQGLTEFLPVSSSGHLLLVEKLGVGEPNLFTNLALHFATLLSVVIVMRKQLWEIITHPLSDRTKFLAVATVPTGIIAALIRYFLPETGEYLPFFFVCTGVILLIPRIVGEKEVVQECTYRDKLVLRALFVGSMQGIACFNGISRSGTTTSALNLCGFDAKRSAEDSFLLSIPIIVASALVELLTGGAKNIKIGEILIGSITAFLVGIAAIKIFFKAIKKDKLWLFAFYAFFAAIASSVLFFYR